MIAQLTPFAPLIILSLGAVALLMLEVFLPAPRLAGAPAAKGLSNLGVRENVTLYTLLFTLFATLLAIYEAPVSSVSSQVVNDALGAYLSFFMVLATIVTLLIGMPRLAMEGVTAIGEFFALILMTLVGVLILVTSADLITLFIGLETMSLGLYCLCGSVITGEGSAMRRSSESSLKYFLLGSFSSAFLLYGIALLYGLTGSMDMYEIAERASLGSPPLLYLAMGFVLVGAIFKVGAVPFHFWAPDVYQGAPTTVTAFMASVVKIASVGVLLRILWQMFHHEVIFWSGVIWVVAVCTMVLGNVVAVRQRSLKRLLAYSSIAHAGYMLTGLLAPGENNLGAAAVLYYLVVYSAMTLGAFGVVSAVTAEHSDGPHPDDVTRFNGLGSRRPFLAAVMTLFLLSLAGLPPGIAGLIGKVYLFSSVVNAGYEGLAIIGVLASAISCYYYLRIVVAMYFVQADHDHEETLALGAPLVSALVLCAAAVVLLGVFPDVLYGGMSAALETW